MHRETRVTLELRFSRRQVVLLLALCALLAQPGALSTESLTLTTYYPSPYGVYNQLRSTNDAYLAYQAGQIGVGTKTPGAGVSSPATPAMIKLDVVGGHMRVNAGEIVSTMPNAASQVAQFRAIAGSYAAMFRNDGSDTYIPLLGAPYGGWNGLRPIRVNNATGDVFVSGSRIIMRHSNGFVGINAVPVFDLDVGGTSRSTTKVLTPEVDTSYQASSCFDQFYGNGTTTNCPGGYYATLADGIKAPVMRVSSPIVSYNSGQGGGATVQTDASGWMRCCLNR